MNAKELSIGTEVFTDLRVKLDAALNTVVSNLISKGMSAGKVTAKIDISIAERTDDNGEIWYEPVFEPSVSVSIGAKGKFDCSAMTGLILKRSGCGRNFIGTNQMSVDDLMNAEEGKGA